MMEDLKLIAAREALKLIRPDSTVGFGAGKTIAYLVGLINSDPVLAASLTVLTSSFSTKLLLQEQGFVIQDTAVTSRINLYFDGCDQFDSHLNALKSGGGIHTMEKLLASMADEFIIIGDKSKYSDKLDTTYPVALEIIPEALSYITNKLKEIFRAADAVIRTGDKKDGPVITASGNYLVDLWLADFPEAGILNQTLNNLPGILSHSLFFELASKAVIAGTDGVVIKVRQ